jgi:hypothetical protein
MLRAIRISQEARKAFQGWLVIFVLMIMLGEVYMRSSTPAAIALNFVQHNPVVQNAMGGVERTRLNWIGNIHYDGNEGWASFKMHVIGGHTNGTMDVTLQRERGQWNVISGTLVTDSGRIVTITEPASTISAER